MAQVNAAIIETVKRFLDKLIMTGIHIEAAYIFGSYARGEEHKWSDIDVAVISPDFINGRFEEGLRLMRLASPVDLRIEPVPFSPDAFVDEDPLAWEIKKEGIKVGL